MRNILNILLITLTSIGFLNAQFADPAITNANFVTNIINVGSQTSLMVNFENSGSTEIPTASIEVTISTSSTFFQTDGITEPSGPGASMFDWTYASVDVWVGVNNQDIIGLASGEIVLNVTGTGVTSTFETASIAVQPIDNLNSFSDVSTNNLGVASLQVNAALADICPTPAIVGDFYGCRNNLLSISVDTFDAANTYTWAVTGNAIILAPVNGNVIVQLPDTTKGMYTLMVTETNAMGCSAIATTVLFIEQNTALVCDDNINLSLNESCTLDITADIVLEGQIYPNSSYNVFVYTTKGDTLPNILSGSEYVGKTFIVSVSHECSGNSCWGNIKLEDKVAPVINCPDQRVVSCFDKTVFPKPVARDNCDLSVPVTEVSNVVNASECGDDFSAVRTITYTAKDKYGNVSLPCEAIIYYTFETLDSLKFPANLASIDDGTFLPCNNETDWDQNGNFYPDIEETGYPTLFGNNILSNNGLCKINSVYTDQVIEVCDRTFKVIREFTVLDWCTGDIVTGTQIIKVADIEGPIITCPADSLFNSYVRPYDCLSDFKVPPPIVITDCSDSITYTVGYLLADDNGEAPTGPDAIYTTANVIGNQQTGYTIKDLPLGRTWIKFIVTDGCGNFTECFTEIDVIDKIPPIAVCDQNTVVGLTTVDFAQVFAATFDDGSYDNCSDMKFEVARMVSGCGTGTGFGPSVVFCCDDVQRTELMVQFRVTDQAGNSNTCMVNVTVQDKAKPIISCPANITIDCEAPNDIASTGGAATAVDNCPGVIVEMTNENKNLTQCLTGTITRTFKATDKSGQTATCSYTVRIENFTPFREQDIRWSTSVRDVTLDDCAMINADPDVTGRPAWVNDECSLVAATYEDEIFNIVDSVCLKILRKWTVIDWCTYNENTGYGKYSYIQAIKLVNTNDPEFTSCVDQTVCVTGPGCGGDVELIVPATDDCTPAGGLKYIYSIDLNNDGTIDRPGGTNNLSGFYETGKHRVIIEVEDGCGNDDKCEFILTVNDCKKPTPYCFTEITTVVMPSSGMIDIWASDFDNGSFDNCPGDMRFSFSSNVNNTQAVFDCDMLGRNTLQMWVTDAAGNQDFCSVKVDIQANPGACEGSTRVAGKVISFDDKIMKNVELTFTNLTSNESILSETNEEGEYSFYNINSNADYKLFPSKDIDYMNGVSTLDLVLIQRHILGIATLDSPYKVIAADVNGSKTISASDLVALRKLILGIDSKFGTGKSWRFVDKSQAAILNVDPWSFTEEVTFNGAVIANPTFDFAGVKIGDVNQSCAVNARDNSSKPRSTNPLNLVVEEANYVANDVVKMEIKVADAYSLFGFQNTFKFNNDNLEFLGVEPGVLDMDQSNIGLTKVLNGLFTTSWSDAKYKNLNQDDVLFSLFFKALNNGELSQDVAISSDLTVIEAYDQRMNVEEIQLNYRSIEKATAGLKVYQNTPNPFSYTTSIQFELSEASDITLKVYDISGRQVYTESGSYKAGNHTLTLNLGNKDLNGILTYSLETPTEKVVNKMVIVK